jgi:hypothetical protein
MANAAPVTAHGGAYAEFRAGKGGNGGSGIGGAIDGNIATVNVTLVGGAAPAALGASPARTVSATRGLDGRPGIPGRQCGANQRELTVQNCLIADAVSGGNGYGGLTDAGHNLSSDDTCSFGGPGSLNETDPGIGELGDYGGLTQTIPLLADSPAINAAAEITGLTSDQRGVARPQGITFDIGAFERPFAGLTGEVRRSDGTPYPGVVLTLISVTASPRTTTSSADGHYEFTPQPGTDLGVYRIQPSAVGPAFSPLYRDLTLTSATQTITGLDFTADDERIVSFGFDEEGRFRSAFWDSQRRSTASRRPLPIVWQEVAQGATDDSGYLEFRPAPASDARLAASSRLELVTLGERGSRGKARKGPVANPKTDPHPPSHPMGRVPWAGERVHRR